MAERLILLALLYLQEYRLCPIPPSVNFQDIQTIITRTKQPHVRKGQGVPKDEGKAIHWFKKAAEQGDADAQKSLGIAAQKGNENAKKALVRLK